MKDTELLIHIDYYPGRKHQIVARVGTHPHSKLQTYQFDEEDFEQIGYLGLKFFEMIAGDVQQTSAPNDSENHDISKENAIPAMRIIIGVEMGETKASTAVLTRGSDGQLHQRPAAGSPDQEQALEAMMRRVMEFMKASDKAFQKDVRNRKRRPR
jgi:hypothetical protein